PQFPGQEPSAGAGNHRVRLRQAAGVPAGLPQGGSPHGLPSAAHGISNRTTPGSTVMRKIALACALLLCFVLTGCEEGECWLCWGDRPNQGRLTLGLTAAPTPRADVLVLA